MRLRISARKSDLARLQAYQVGAALLEKNPDLQIEYSFKTSLGDINLTDPLWKIPTKGVFTEDFQSDLIKNQTDMVVHSWKDLPTEETPLTCIAASLKRADQRDLLLIKKNNFLSIQNKKYLKLLSSSPRRIYNLNYFCHHYLPWKLDQVEFESVRGNILTRIKKALDHETADGIIVAKAALDRLLASVAAEFMDNQKSLKEYLQHFEWCLLPLSVNPNAAAQGALAIEVLRSRTDLIQILQEINDTDSFTTSTTERLQLQKYGGGCHQKIGIAHLKRSYGDIFIEKGELNSLGSIHRLELKTHLQWTCSEEQLWNGKKRSIFVRQSRPIELDMFTQINLQQPIGFWVSRSSAWPADISLPKEWQGWIWCAGLKTWQYLAKKGMWVHGCSEGLGEQEDPRLDTLVGKQIHWKILTHQKSEELKSILLNPDKNKSHLITYQLVESEASEGESRLLQQFDYFYWMSASQFMWALEKHPAIATKHHACGPGNSYQIIQHVLKQKGCWDKARLQIVLEPESLLRQ